jgi:hypothetical protein
MDFGHHQVLSSRGLGIALQLHQVEPAHTSQASLIYVGEVPSSEGMPHAARAEGHHIHLGNEGLFKSICLELLSTAQLYYFEKRIICL